MTPANTAAHQRAAVRSRPGAEVLPLLTTSTDAAAGAVRSFEFIAADESCDPRGVAPESGGGSGAVVGGAPPDPCPFVESGMSYVPAARADSSSIIGTSVRPAIFAHPRRLRNGRKTLRCVDADSQHHYLDGSLNGRLNGCAGAPSFALGEGWGTES